MIWIVLFVSLLATLIPTIFYARILGWFDRFENTYSHLGLGAFLWGVLPAVILVLVSDLILRIPLRALDITTDEMMNVGLMAPLTEEPSKALILLIFFFKLGREHDDPIVWIIYGGLAGFGFALTENIFYFLDAAYLGGVGLWMYVVFMRSFFFGLNHALFTSLTGLGLGLARVRAPFFARVLFAGAGLGAAMLFHALHNLGMIQAQTFPSAFRMSVLTDWAGVAGVGILMLLIKREENMRALKELREELENGVIDANDYALATSLRTRLTTRVLALVSRRAKTRIGWLAPRLADLAFAKYQYRKGRDYARAIQALRMEILGIRTALNH